MELTACNFMKLVSKISLYLSTNYLVGFLYVILWFTYYLWRHHKKQLVLTMHTHNITPSRKHTGLCNNYLWHLSEAEYNVHTYFACHTIRELGHAAWSRERGSNLKTCTISQSPALSIRYLVQFDISKANFEIHTYDTKICLR